MSDERKINLLIILKEGCQHYQAYRGRITSTGNCDKCVVIFKTHFKLNKMQKFGYSCAIFY